MGRAARVWHHRRFNPSNAPNALARQSVADDGFETVQERLGILEAQSVNALDVLAYIGHGGRSPHRLPVMVNSFLTFENDCYSDHNGIRHSRGTCAYAEVNQDPGVQKIRCRLKT